ncbi:NAD(P)/FAD-dependent oxidoreductase [Ruegeria hyattellae]|uniref:NAD(P)/FAD-dependent oxidoreductase n=1 Tax=Ruegeria hyattellae TaxID=3233337 RepID=UPI00355AE329
MPQTVQQFDTAIVGAGIIGAALGYELQKRGHRVVLIDRDMPGHGASFGNMASIAVTEFMPISRPSVWFQTPRWLLDPQGPIRVAPNYAPRLIPWFLRFFRAGWPAKLRQLQADGAVLCQRALADMQALMAEIGLADDISETGCLSLYANAQEFEADRERLEMLDRFGFDYDVIDRNRLRDLEPEIAPVISKAVLLPDNRTVRNPLDIVTRLAEIITARGGKIMRDEVIGFDVSGEEPTVRLANGSGVTAKSLVISAGAFSARLSSILGEPMPLETERGYHTQIMAPGIALNHSLIWPAKAFMVSPTAGGIRVGGTVEMAGLNAAPDFRRAEITAKRAREALPNLRLANTSEWMGHRPSFPDTIPVMSASAKISGVFYSTGHGHLGLTHAATNAHLMADLICGATSAIDMNAYSVTRF